MTKSDGWSYYLICSFCRDKKKVFQWPHHAIAYRNVHDWSQWNVKMRRMKLWTEKFSLFKTPVVSCCRIAFSLFYLNFVCLIRMMLAMVYAFGMNEWLLSFSVQQTFLFALCGRCRVGNKNFGNWLILVVLSATAKFAFAVFVTSYSIFHLNWSFLFVIRSFCFSLEFEGNRD